MTTIERPLHLVPTDDDTGYEPASPDMEADALVWISAARAEAAQQGELAAGHRREAARCAQRQALLLTQAAELEGMLWA